MSKKQQLANRVFSRALPEHLIPREEKLPPKKPKRRANPNPTIITKPMTLHELIPHPVTMSHIKPKELIQPKTRLIHEINGIGMGMRSARFHQNGITTVEQFVDADIETIASILGWRENGARPFHVRAMALHEERIIQMRQLEQIHESPIYLDIETDLFQQTIWMIGILNGSSGEFTQLVANSPVDVPVILQHALDILSSYPGKLIVSYSSSNFDERILKKCMAAENLSCGHLMFRDILLDIKPSLAFPIPSYKLNDIAAFYGYPFRHPDLDGMQVALTYERYARDLRACKQYDILCEYNEDDVRSLASLVEHLYF